MKKIIAVLLSVTLLAGSLAACGGNQSGSSGSTSSVEKKGTIIVGASASPHAEILEQVKDDLAAEGWDLQIKVYDDYIQPNLALESGELTANYFQHKLYLTDFNEKNNTHLVSAAEIHYEPFGIYPGRTKALADLADGAIIAVPNDPTNEARALLLLEAQGLIKLKDSTNLQSTAKDIVENKKNLQFREIAAEQLVRSLPDVDLAVINGNYALLGNLNVTTDSLAVESADSVAKTTYVNVLAVKSGDETKPAIEALVKALKSDKVKSFIEEKYKGAVVPTF